MLLALLCALGLLPGDSQGQEEKAPTPEEMEAAENAPLFASHELLELTLEADFHTIRREDRSDEDSEERPATMRWTTTGGSAGVQEIQIQTRGNFRLSRRNCDFPPLRINVKREATKGTLFDGQDKLKLVVTCKLGRDYWEQYVLAEYLVYRMFNLFTPLSFRVRLARVTYQDTSGEDDPFTRYAFILEDDDAMATRNGGWKLDWDTDQGFHPVLLDTHQALLVDVFQYMIGNTDWSGVQMHNMELLKLPPNRHLIVPFDFDFAGIIDTRYARPDASLPIRSVRQRIFRGICPEQINRSAADYDPIFQEFRERQEEIYDLWRNQEGLDPGRLEDTLEYLEEFFGILADQDRTRTHILDQCRRIG
jgi:hypothetical protein